jgi:hypothetical protein
VAGAAGETIDAAREKFANDIGKKVATALINEHGRSINIITPWDFVTPASDNCNAASLFTSCQRDVRSLGGGAALVTVGLRDLVAIAGADGSKSFASSSGVRLARTNSIICRRNSSA